MLGTRYQSSKLFKIPENHCPCVCPSIGQVGDLMSCGSKIHPVSCNDTHDVTDLVNHGIVEN